MNHTIEVIRGEFAPFCACGADTFVCQKCRRALCSEEAKPVWVEGTGSVCKDCAGKPSEVEIRRNIHDEIYWSQEQQQAYEEERRLRSEEPDTIRLSTGREVPIELLDAVIEASIIQHAGYGFDESFCGSVDTTIQSLQEDPGWLPDDNNLAYEEAIEVWSIVKEAAQQFANELAQAYFSLREKYIGTKSWELYRQKENVLPKKTIKIREVEPPEFIEELDREIEEEMHSDAP